MESKMNDIDNDLDVTITLDKFSNVKIETVYNLLFSNPNAYLV